MQRDASGYVLSAEEGEGLWFLGTLLTIKAGGPQTGGALTVVEQLAPPGFGPPRHLHRWEDEAFYILEGQLTVSCGDRTWLADRGAFIWLPRGIAHSFVVSSAAPARLLQITAPAQFERFAAEVGEPAGQRTLPPRAAPDLPRLREAMARYGYELAEPPGSGPAHSARHQS